MTSNLKINQTFSVPICEYQISGFDKIQSDLVAHIHELKNTKEGIQSSNYNGWHSDRKLHEDPAKPVQWLVRRMNMACIKAIQQLNDTTEGVDIRLREMWANVNQKGSWNMPHIHAVKWSGVIYIDGDCSSEEEAPKNRKLKDGDTAFLNPVPEAAYFGIANSVSYSFEPGKMLFFPGYLMHMVVPHQSDSDRITIAFNVDRVQLESQRKPAPVKTVETTPQSISPSVEIIG